MKRFQLPSFIKISLGVLMITIPSLLSGQTKTNGQMPQYVFSGFSSCDVRMKSGQIQNTMMNYNMVTERMVYLKDGQYFDLANTEMVDTVYLHEKKFVPFGKTFFEMLQSRPVALFIQNKGELEEAGKPSGYGGTSKTASASYLANFNQSKMSYNLPIPEDYTVRVSNIYWIRKDDKMIDFQNEKQFLKLFPEKSDLIKSFIKKNRLKFENPDDLAHIVNYLSTLK